ncbi:XF1762 family protein [Streptomyces bobili]|uniref:XF1762 family protein n=1 Tax=Streptomyces bobili TaxID=67280 RepID=UPI0036EB0297
MDEIHRHHARPQGHKFSIGLLDATGTRVGVAIVGRPVARHLDDGWTLEVTRPATDGSPDACSALYTLPGEPTCCPFRACGWAGGGLSGWLWPWLGEQPLLGSIRIPISTSRFSFSRTLVTLLGAISRSIASQTARARSGASAAANAAMICR